MRVKFQNEPQALNKDLLKHTVELVVVRSIRYLRAFGKTLMCINNSRGNMFNMI